MSATDNIYIYDSESDENTMNVLGYLLENILDINRICKRYVRIYKLSNLELKDKTIENALDKRKVKSLPSMVIFNPRSEVLVGADEIILFYQVLMYRITELKKQPPPRGIEGPALLDETQMEVNNFYQNEIMGDVQERSVSGDMSGQMTDRYREQIAVRGPSEKRGSGIELNDEEDGPLDFNKTLQERRKGRNAPQPPPPNADNPSPAKPSDSAGSDNVMRAVSKITDDPAELAFYTNLLEDSSKL